MNRRCSLFALVALCLVLFGAVPASAQESAVDAYLEDWRQANAIPGVAVAVIDGSEVTTHLLGEDGDADPVGASTPFLIGSVSKTFTSTLVLQLAGAGLLSLDDEARVYLPWLDHTGTVAQLLDHTAGYTAADGLAVSERYDEDLGVTEAATLLDHSGRAGEHRYSSANYLVLGALVEAVTGQEFADVLQARITGPTGMDTTDVDGRVDDLPAGHRYWWGRAAAYSPGAEPSGAPYGYLVSTLEDLGSYARAHLDGELIPEQSRDLAWSDQIATNQAQGYGLGWRIDNGDDVLRVHHTGATPGYFAHLMLMPEQDRAVIILANAYSEAAAASLAAAAADIDDLGQGLPAVPASGDSILLMLLPWLALIPVGLAVLGLAVLWFRRPRTRTRGLVLGSVSLVLAGVLLGAPSLMGMTWHAARTWAPDAALALVVGTVGWTALAVFLVIAGLRKSPTSEA